MRRMSLNGPWRDAFNAYQAQRHVVMYGHPGSGKSSFAQYVFLDAYHRYYSSTSAIEGNNNRRPVMIAPTRRRADMANLDPEIMKMTWSRPVHTPMSLAFEIVDQWHRQRIQPLAAPALFTGGDEDAHLYHLLEKYPVKWPYDLGEDVIAMDAFRSELRELFAQCETYNVTAEELRRQGKQNNNPMWVGAADIYDAYRSRTGAEYTVDDNTDYSLFDIVQLQYRAAHIITNWERDQEKCGVTAQQPDYPVIVVDDFHDCGIPTLRLLEALAHAGSQIIATSSPDECVNSYRGAHPYIGDHLRHLDPYYGFAETSYTISPPVAALYNRVIARLPRRNNPMSATIIPVHSIGGDTTGVEPLRCVRAQSFQQLGVYISGHMRRSYLSTKNSPSPIDWSDMAVVCRTQREVAQLRAALNSHAIPLEDLPRPLILSEHPGVTPIIDTYELAKHLTAKQSLDTESAHLQASRIPPTTTEDELVGDNKVYQHKNDTATKQLNADEGNHINKTTGEAPLAEGSREKQSCDAEPDSIPKRRADGNIVRGILQSRYIGINSYDMRQLMKVWTFDNCATEESLSFEDFLVRLVQSESVLTHISREYPWLAPTIISDIRRAAKMLEAATNARGSAGPALWKIWQAAQCGEKWRIQSQQKGVLARQAHDDLNAVIALFRSADFYTQRNENADIDDFLGYITSQKIRVDNVSAAKKDTRGVEVITTAEAAGKQKKLVFITGLHHQMWPRAISYSSLFSVTTFIDMMHQKLDGVPTPPTLVSPYQGGDNMLDELRAFGVALTRSCGEVIVCALDNDTTVPSQFFQWAQEHGVCEDISAKASEMIHPMSLRGLVAKMRRQLSSSSASHNEQQQASEVLALLASQGVEQAHPRMWTGGVGLRDSVVGLSTHMPLASEDDVVRISPSKIEAMHQCSLRWFFSSVQGTPYHSDAQNMGLLVHAIAEQAAHTSQEKMSDLEKFAEEEGIDWQEKPQWHRQADMERLRTMLEQMAIYFAAVRRPSDYEKLFDCEQVPLKRVETEVPCSHRYGNDVVYGFIDRLEFDEHGCVRIVDLKTGKNAPSKKEAEENPQLQCYQLLIKDMLKQPLAGARLVYPGVNKTKPKIMGQAALSEETSEDTRRMIGEAGKIVRNNTMNACTNTYCEQCEFRICCPLQSEGRRTLS
ncbi:MAG: PD-(D/E)XK nuclease family protein [Actinomycetaceae bacterium]|nr:PD-(D/E)XK nuclease family protein [Actinomycetaceae bacterium]